MQGHAFEFVSHRCSVETKESPVWMTDHRVVTQSTLWRSYARYTATVLSNRNGRILRADFCRVPADHSRHNTL